MGWDASAFRNGRPLAIASRYTPEYWSIEDLPLREAFQRAASRVRDAVGGAPEYLDAAMLSGWYDRIAFERAFAIQFDDYPGGTLEWSAEELQTRAAQASWLTPDDETEVSAYWTVRAFVTVCVENDLGVHFSW